MVGAAECAERLESGHRAFGATVGAVFGGMLLLTNPDRQSTKLISRSPPAPCAFRRTGENSKFLHRGLAANVDVVGVVLVSLLVLLRPYWVSSWVPLGGSWVSFAGQRVNGIGLGGRFGGAAPVR